MKNKKTPRHSYPLNKENTDIGLIPKSNNHDTQATNITSNDMLRSNDGVKQVIINNIAPIVDDNNLNICIAIPTDESNILLTKHDGFKFLIEQVILDDVEEEQVKLYLMDILMFTTTLYDVINKNPISMKITDSNNEVLTGELLLDTIINGIYHLLSSIETDVDYTQLDNFNISIPSEVYNDYVSLINNITDDNTNIGE